ncbi:hypothetical protein HYDPIDRAFT_33946 [Hydnomerulius pinastri MD-312]|uniref:Uncharacterized protein n=1 Tax=Hydnomerulius pinastri MD-312 TaxID=994086 RepID=A0A0C9VZ47_9AGAM|nr:hypothetical protein HYDPIDRAFT_33946 [Hydnomerulius pinastri MD-312]
MSTLTVANLPYPGSKNAPTKFKGDYTKVKPFIKHYERLLAQCSVTTDKEKCENITQYCSTRVSNFIEVLSDYVKPDWDKLKAAILKHFDADRDTKRYKVNNLLRFVKVQKEKPINSLASWTKFQRDFVQIADWLKTRGKITDDEYSTYLWQSIHRGLRMRLENRLLSSDPNRDMTKPFKVSDIIDSAEKYLQCDRFDSDLVYTDSDQDSEWDLDNSDTEDSESEYDSDGSLKRYKKRAKRTPKATEYKATRIQHRATDDE